MQHPLIENKKINFKYAVQIKQKPVTIKIFCNFSSKLKNNYKSYLINNFNKNFKIFLVNIDFILYCDSISSQSPSYKISIVALGFVFAIFLSLSCKYRLLIEA